MSESQFEKLLKTLSEKDAEIKRLREENECFEAMKAGVEIRIADLNAKIERLREENKRLMDGMEKDNTSYKDPGIWINSKNQIWTGPLAPNENMHFARFHGFMDDSVTPIWVLERSECPEDCVLVGFKLIEKIERLRELLGDLYERGGISNELWDRIKKEVGDE